LFSVSELLGKNGNGDTHTLEQQLTLMYLEGLLVTAKFDTVTVNEMTHPSKTAKTHKKQI